LWAAGGDDSAALFGGDGMPRREVRDLPMSGTLAESLQLQGSIIHALFMKDMQSRFTTGRLGALITIGEPLIMVTGLYILRYYVLGVTVVHGLPLIVFIVTGYMIYHCFRLVTSGVTSGTSRKANSQALPQVTPMDQIVARACSSMFTNGTAMLISFVLAYLWTGVQPASFLLLIQAGVLGLLLGVPVGMFIGCVARLFPFVTLVTSMLLRLNLFISGVLVTADEVPTSLLRVMIWNPTFHVIEMMREAWYPGYVSLYADPMFVLTFLLIAIAVSMSFERITSRFKMS
jgi:capsular polysaccharide transport system permease protein